MSPPERTGAGIRTVVQKVIDWFRKMGGAARKVGKRSGGRPRRKGGRRREMDPEDMMPPDDDETGSVLEDDTQDEGYDIAGNNDPESMLTVRRRR